MTQPHPGLFRHALHAVVCVAAFFPWLLGVAGFGMALGLTILADKLWPEADWGNCWTFAGPKFYRHGGYILSRPADGVRIPGVGSIPHAIWVPQLHEETVTLHTEPVHRHRGRWLAWMFTVYFKYTVRCNERPHNSAWMPHSED